MTFIVLLFGIIPMCYLFALWGWEVRGKYKNRCSRHDCYVCYPKENDLPLYVCDDNYSKWVDELKALRHYNG